MKDISIQLNSKKLGRLTGLIYFFIILCGLYGGIAVRGTILVPLDPVATLENLIVNEKLFRFGFLSDLIMVISDVTISVLFFYLLKSTDKIIALFAMIFRLIQSSVLAANLMNLFSPILLIKNYETMNLAEKTDLSFLVMQKMEMFEHGYLISGVFFAINCALMGYLLYKSTLFPNMLGIMIFIASFGYLFNCFSNFIAPDLIETSQMLMFITAVISELSLCFYLLIKGCKVITTLEL